MSQARASKPESARQFSDAIPGLLRWPRPAGGSVHAFDLQQVEVWEDAGAWPEDMFRGAVRRIGEEIGNRGTVGLPWSAWREIEPLGVELSTKIEPTEWEKKFAEGYKHIKDVCHRPAAQLQHEVERMPVHRAKRIPFRALEHLASHTEDWLRRTTTGVQPSRILSRQNDLVVDIYENRLVRRLIDFLARRLAQRAADVERLHATIEELDRLQRDATGDHQRMHRVFELYGKATDAHRYKAIAEKTLTSIRELRRLLMGLRESRLYLETSPNQGQGLASKRTNIIDSDARYRTAARLLELLSRGASEPPPTPDQLLEDYLRDFAGFDSFCRLLVVRALDQLGWRPADDGVVPTGEGEIHVQTLYGDRLLRCFPDGTLEIRCLDDDDPSIRIVPLFTPARSFVESARMDALRDAVINIAAQTPGRLLVLYLDTWRERDIPVRTQSQEKSLWGLGSELMGFEPEISPRVGLLPVSPFVLSSVERVARAIRWTFMPSVLGSYPAQISYPLEVQRQVVEIPASFQTGQHDRAIAVVHPPTPREMEVLRGSVERAVRTLASKGRKYERERELLKKWRSEVEDAGARLSGLMICPVCSKAAGHYDFHGGQEGYECQCSEPSCKDVRWGLEACATCGSPIPFLGTRPRDDLICDEGPGDIDREFGRDILGVPSMDSNGRVHRYCTECRVLKREGHEARDPSTWPTPPARPKSTD